MKDDINILLERRRELQLQINKLQEEHKALGNAISKLMEVTEQEMKEEALSRIKTEIKQQDRNGRTDIYLKKEDIRAIGGAIEGNGRTYIDINEVNELIDEYER